MNSRNIWGRIMVIVCALSLCSFSYAEEEYIANSVEEDPSALAMAVDLVAVRPVMFGVTIAGSALWLVSLPFSAAGGNVKNSAETLVVEPAKTTFVRCLGCTRNGYSN